MSIGISLISEVFRAEREKAEAEARYRIALARHELSLWRKTTIPAVTRRLET
jgi:hypothetical protein